MTLAEDRDADVFESGGDRGVRLMNGDADGRDLSEAVEHGIGAKSIAPPELEGEDLVNAAVVETLKAGGEVFVLPEEKMREPVAAILRY